MTIQLEQEQEELLSMLVEAYRNVPREQRRPFHVITVGNSSYYQLLHPGLPNGKAEAYPGDIETLDRENLLALKYDSWGLSSFDIIPQGLAYYKQIKQRDGQPLQRIEANLRNYLGSAHFQQKYARAYQKWKDAEVMLWDSDSQRQLTTIGHLCREAIQEFATVIVDRYQPPKVEADKTKTIARLRAILDLFESQLGSTEQPFLKALLAYWGTVGDLIQRQEHGSHKEGQPLVWEDGRRVVLQTAIVMLEIDSCLSRMAKLM